MELIDRGLSWLWRVAIMVGLIIGVLAPPMLLRLINQLATHTGTLGWQIAIMVAYFGVFILLILAADAVKRHYTGIYESEPLTKRDWGAVLLGYLVIVGLESGFQALNHFLYGQTQTQNNAAIKQLMTGSPFALWMMAFSAVLLTPIVEELVFRGVLMNLFFNQGWLKVTVSGVLFGSLHSSSTWPSFLIYVTMGLILATVYLRVGKIKAAIALHFIINALAMGILIGQIFV
ncbi:CPBP family intramembrane glutamic endopeptidase [Lactiplantibacillus modestisalitolerans]|uniref:Lysostaphin resistance A-like protein n=1 Tax=Lactiplantibacillus modestisalitolerans TaxID=1457219 RepID=A0ABV5WQN7_9LACO|nr:type II CAAX endopeptidase family protein [Lactiplantibacillus modestisalitolerans]